MSLPAVSPRVRRKSLGLSERNLNNFDDNMTLPITKYERSVKGHKRSTLSMGGDPHSIAASSSLDSLSDMQRRRRSAQPRRSILRPPAYFAMEEDSNIDDSAENDNTGMYEHTVDFGAMSRRQDKGLPMSSRAPRASLPAHASEPTRAGMAPRRRVSFAPSAHVRMFEKPQVKKPRRQSSMGAPKISFAPQSPRSSSSRNSQSAPSPSRRSSLPKAPVAPQSPRYFVGEGEEGGEESMELEETESEADDESGDDTLDNISVPPPRPTTPAPALDDGYGSEDASGSDMDETVVLGGPMTSQWSDDSDDETDMDMEESDTEMSAAENDEEKTMDFTVALGGPMPSAAPQHARRNRASIGYSHAAEPGERPLLPGEGSDLEDGEMEFTGVYGGVVAVVDDSISSGDDTTHSRDPEQHTATYGYGAGDNSGMDFTSVGGGIAYETGAYSHAGDESGMEITSVGGGIVYQNTSVYGRTNVFAPNPADESAMDLTTVGGGIASQDTASYRTATMTVNIFAPPSAADAANDTHHSDYLTAGDGMQYPILSPVKVPGHAVMQADAPSTSTSSRRGRSQSPVKASAPNTPSAKSKRLSEAGHTPAFARPTASSVSKSREREAHSTSQPSSQAKSTQKRNVFAPSPNETPRSRSSRRKSSMAMDTAASVAKRLDFGPSPKNTPASTSGRASISSRPATPRAPTPKTMTPRAATPRAPKTATTTPAAAPPSTLPFSTGKRRREDSSPDAELGQGSAKKSRMSVVPVPAAPEPIEPSPVEPSPVEAAEGYEEEDMEMEEDEIVEEEPQDAGTPPPVEDAERPMPSFTGTPHRFGGMGRPSMGSPVRLLKSPAEGVLVQKRASMGFMSGARASFGMPPPRAKSMGFPSSRVSFGYGGNDDGYDEDDENEDAEPKPVQLNDFLRMAGVEFPLLNSKALASRRSSVGRGILGRSTIGHDSDVTERQYATHHYFVAAVERIFLNMFTWSIKNLRRQMAEAEEAINSTEALCNSENPVVVRDYLSASDDDRALFEMTLREYKANTYLRARSAWYDWKLEIMERTVPDVREVLDEMREDAERHAASIEVADSLLPDLRKRRDELEAELKKHREHVAQIEECDGEELQALKEEIEEGNVQITAFTTELQDHQESLAELQAKKAELDLQRAGDKAALAAAKSVCNELTASDVARLEHEYRALQDVHQWRVLRLSDNVELAFAHELALTVPAPTGPEHPDATRAGVSLLFPPQQDSVEAAMLALTRASLRGLRRANPKLIATLPGLIAAVGQLWVAAQRIRSELSVLGLSFPTTTQVCDAEGEEALHIKTTLMLPSARSKVHLTFTVGAQTLLLWPATVALAEVDVRAETVYGEGVDGEGIVQLARDRLGNAVTEFGGALFQAAADVVDMYA